jgi:hypothetical protein
LGTALHRDITDAERTKWRSGSPSEWAEESYTITLTPAVEYCNKKADACCYPKGDTCERNGSGKATLHLHDSYLDAHSDAVETQMKKAGVRLAWLIEQALGEH